MAAVGRRPMLDMDFPPSQPLDMSAITGQHPNPSVPSDLTHISFNVPFNSNLAGPSLEDILYASSTQKSLERWVHPEGTSEDTPANKLPVHTANLTALRKQCERLATEPSGPAPVQASVIAFEPKHEPSLRRPRKGLVTNVCLSGPDSVVRKARGQILRSSPIMISAIVDVEVKHLIDVSTNSAYAHSIEELDLIAQHAGVDIFLLSPKPVDGSSRAADGGPATGIDDRLRVAIYGDVESVEVARTRILIMIDKLMGMNVDAERAEVTMHPMIAGRARRNITMIEAMTETQIYLPYPFSGAFGYVPSGLDRQERERLDQIFITGKPENIAKAQLKLREISSRLKLFSKTISLSPAKIDSIILDRMSKIRKTMERNATHVQLPPLGSQSSMIRVQGMEGVHIERTCREIMVMAGQFYSASWWVSPMTPVPTDIKAPSAVDTRTTLSDVCVSSGAELSYDKSTFSICGSDESVRWALSVLHAVKYTTRTPYQIRVKLELAQEHKEFVSGKKNGKINKIMSQSNVQIIFDNFSSEYNFHLDVVGAQYTSVMKGLELVEQEMPASVSFHVPDQYHKRIIGIGGQHIQRIMKKYSVFVKFSNALDRGAMGRADEDIKMDNVICRTPARNAANLDKVKDEIMSMVEKADAEYVTEIVAIRRVFHRDLIARISQIADLERKWSCKISFPSTELASDKVTVHGPEWQVPHAINELLGMVRERHEVKLPGTPEFKKYLKSERFIREVQVPLKDHHEVLMRVMDDVKDDDSTHQTVELTWTKDNEGGLKDALDFLVNKLIVNGLDAGSIKDDTRLQSDTFEQILPFFNPAVLQARPPTAGSGSPIKPNFMSLPKPESKGSIFDRLRRPGMASITSFLERRKRNAGSPAELFRHASANASRASLVSVESQESGFRNPWNDSGINLPDDDSTKHLRTGSSYSVNSLTSLKLTDSNGRSEVRSIGSPVGHHGSGFRSGPASRKSTMNSVSSATRPAMSRPPSATPGSQPSVPQQMPHILQQHVKHQQLQLPANLQVPPKPQQPRGVTPLTPQK